MLRNFAKAQSLCYSLRQVHVLRHIVALNNDTDNIFNQVKNTISVQQFDENQISCCATEKAQREPVDFLFVSCYHS